VTSAGRERGVRVVATVHGYVQGVGYRAFVRGRLARLGLTGSASNLPDGTVEVRAEGPRHELERLLAALDEPEAPGQVRRVEASWDEQG